MPIPATREDLVTDLKSNVCRVVFKKRDDSLRTMSCTLREDMLPSQEVKNLSASPSNQNVVPVWDTDKNAWRSFRLDSILDFAPIQEQNNEQESSDA